MESNPVLVSACVSLAVSVITSFVAYFIHREKLKSQYKLEDSAEVLIRELLRQPKWTKRSFNAIQEKVGGFEPQELRKLLVRSGAIRFRSSDSEEMWGLLSRNKNEIG